MPITSRRVLFNDGEGLVHSDLNQIGVEQANMVLDRKLYANMVLMQAGLDGGDNYNTQWDNANFVENMAFCGGGLSGRVNATKNSSNWNMSPGMMYQYVGAGKPIAGGNRCLEFQIDNSEISGTVTPPGSGTRWDRLEMKLEAVAGVSQTRDFEDATTRAKTTTTFDKRTQTEATFQIRQGVLNNGIDNKGLIDGFVPVCFFEVTSAGVQTVHNVSYPLQTGMKTYDCILGGSAQPDAGFAKNDPDTNMGWGNGANAFAEIYMPFPYQTTSRILGIAMTVNTPGTGMDIDLYNYRGGSRTLLENIGVSGLTASTLQNVFIDFMPDQPNATPSTVDVHVRAERACWTNYGGDATSGPYTHRGNSIHGGNHLVIKVGFGFINANIFEFKYIFAD